MDAPVVVLACGALDRSDDAAGLLAARVLRARLPGVEVEEVGDLSVDDLTERPAGQRVVILDAAVGPAPGEVVRLRFEDLPGSRARPRSSHELPIPEMVGLASLLAGEALEGELVAIGIATTVFGPTLSPAVQRGMPAFVAAAERAVLDAALAAADADGAAVGPLPVVRPHAIAPSRRAHVVASPRRRAARWRRRFAARA